MWNESLIESMGGQNNGKRWLTVQIAAIVHAAIVGVLVAGSFWYVDRMSLPATNKISAVFYETFPGGPPPAQGVPQPPRNETPTVDKLISLPTPLNQEQMVPENNNKITETDSNEGSGDTNLPAGVPWGVPHGDPESAAKNFGGGNGTAETHIPEEHIYPPTEVHHPVILNQIKPDYPELLRRSRKEGIVVLQAVITKTGSVKDVSILQSAHPLFDQAAITAVRQWKYRPATLNGKPVSVYFTVTVSFKLR